MAGLLDNRVGDALKGALGAGALGVNPAIGLLFGKGIRESRERREMENKQLRDSMAAKDEMGALFSRMDTVQTPGQSVAGPGRLVPGILAGPDGVGSDPVQIPGRREWVPGAEKQVPAIQTPQGQHELMGLLARVDPAAAAQAAMPQNQRMSTDIPTMQMLGYDISPEGYSQFKQAGGSTDDIETRQRMIQIELAMQDLKDRRKEEQDAIDASGQQDRFTTSKINRVLGNVETIYGLNAELDGSMLEMGVPMGDWIEGGTAFYSWVNDRFGRNTPEADRMLATRSNLENRLNDLVIESLDRFGDDPTNAKVRILRDAKANPNMAPAAVANVVGSIGQLYLEKADDMNLPIEERQYWDGVIEKAMNYSPYQKQQQQGSSVRDQMLNLLGGVGSSAQGAADSAGQFIQDQAPVVQGAAQGAVDSAGQFINQQAPVVQGAAQDIANRGRQFIQEQAPVVQGGVQDMAASAGQFVDENAPPAFDLARSSANSMAAYLRDAGAISAEKYNDVQGRIANIDPQQAIDEMLTFIQSQNLNVPDRLRDAATIVPGVRVLKNGVIVRGVPDHYTDKQVEEWYRNRQAD